MSERIKVVIAGVAGRMGRASAGFILGDPALQLIGGFDRPGSECIGQDIGAMTNAGPAGILVSNSIEDLPAEIQPDVLLDFSIADAAFENAQKALERNIRTVIGTSGLGDEKIAALTQLSESKKLGTLVVPNFSVGAVLMMDFARQAGAFFENVEIVEMHHTKKVDAPSGTAVHTANSLASLNKPFNQLGIKEHETIPHARGAVTDSGVRVHSLRLPGLISHQEVLFGAPGELLTVKHDSFNTDCFAKGILMAVRSVLSIDGLVVGLDKIMGLSGAAERQKIGGRSS